MNENCFRLVEILATYLRKSEYLESTLETFFATGNLVSESGLGLQQDKGKFESGTHHQSTMELPTNRFAQA